jgi:hypothetical protein
MVVQQVSNILKRGIKRRVVSPADISGPMLIDLHHKVRSLEDQASIADNHYDGDIFSFEIADRVVAEAYAILKQDVNIFGALDTIRRRLMLLNAEKRKMLAVLTMSYANEFKAEQEKFGIVNPYKAR